MGLHIFWYFYITQMYTQNPSLGPNLVNLLLKIPVEPLYGSEVLILIS